MSHDKGDETHTFMCDGPKCNEFYEGFHEQDFKETLEEAKREGWVARRGRDGDWEHYCPACKEDRK